MKMLSKATASNKPQHRYRQTTNTHTNGKESMETIDKKGEDVKRDGEKFSQFACDAFSTDFHSATEYTRLG